MKQSFGKSFLSCFLAVTLMASVIAGAISVCCFKASAAAGQDIYANELRAYFLDLAPSQSSDINAFFDKVDAALEVGSQKCVFAGEKNGYWIINIYNLPTGTNVYSYADQYGNSGISKSTGWANVNFLREAYFAYNGSVVYAPTSDQFYALMGEGFNYSNPAYWSYYFVPNIYDYQSANVYSSIDILPYGGFSFSANLFAGDAPPSYDEINLVSFNVGIKRFLTVDDQDYVQGMDPDKEGYTWALLGLDKDGNDFDRILSDADLVVVPNADFYTDELFNLATYGALCWELPDEFDVVASSGFGVRNELGQIDHLVAVCVNCPYWINEELPTEDQLIDQQYMQAFNTFNSYVNSYNTTHVVPETLAETLFGVEGGKLYPVSVSEPSSVASTRNDGALVDGNLYTFQWAMTEPNNLGYNYELFDVVIIPSNYAGYYGLVYFYDSSLNPAYQFVDRVSFDSLLNSFDCIIIVPDDAGTLEDNTWWQQLIDPVFRGDMAVGGTSSLGVEYVDTVSGNEFQGFMIVTKKAIQKQQLYVFNDGITKTYKLMADYIDKRGDWEDSFLAWTASLFEQYQTLDGRLSSIYSLLFDLHLSDWMADISSKLDEIVNNTGEFEWNFWYMSLFSWVNQFKPDNSDFAAGLQQFDNNWEEFPDLPAPSTVPLLPTIGG